MIQKICLYVCAFALAFILGVVAGEHCPVIRHLRGDCRRCEPPCKDCCPCCPCGPCCPCDK